MILEEGFQYPEHKMRDPSQRVTVDKKTGRVHVETVNDQPSMAQQQFKDQCDVNNIMKRYGDTGQISHLASNPGFYADLVGLGDYQEMIHKVMSADNAFMTLPADVRLRFGNDPGQLIQFLEDPGNREEAVKLGLLESPKPAEPAPPAPAAPGAASAGVKV